MILLFAIGFFALVLALCTIGVLLAKRLRNRSHVEYITISKTPHREGMWKNNGDFYESSDSESDEENSKDDIVSFHGGDQNKFGGPLRRDLAILLRQQLDDEPNEEGTLVSYSRVCFSASGAEEIAGLQKLCEDLTYKTPLYVNVGLAVLGVRLCMVANNMVLHTGHVPVTPIPSFLQGEKYTLFSTISNRREAFGWLIAPNVFPDLIILVFRGTTSSLDWIKDLTMTQVSLSYMSPMYEKPYNMYRGSVHKGFFDIYRGLSKALKDALLYYFDSRGNQKRKLWIIGHSLGGGLGTIAAYMLSMWSGGNISIMVNTYGSPRVGDKDFCIHYNSIVPNTIRFRNEKDIITDLPSTFLNYRHVQTVQEMHVNPTAIALSNQNSPHSLLAYLYGLDTTGLEFLRVTNRTPAQQYALPLTPYQAYYGFNATTSSDGEPEMDDSGDFDSLL